MPAQYTNNNFRSIREVRSPPVRNEVIQLSVIHQIYGGSISNPKAAAKDNPKAFFAHVNSRKPVKNTIGPLKDRTGSIISTDEGMANIFNEYFASVYTEEDTSEIPIVPIVYRGNNPLRKIEITVDKV